MDEILKIVNKFLKKMGITAYWNEEFEAICTESKIGITLAPLAEDTELFVRDAMMRYPEIAADPFLWLMFHEVGHVMTEGMWSEEEQEYFDYQKEKCSYIEDTQSRNDWYHATPDEFMATRWAAMYMKKNTKKVAKFWDKLSAAIVDFYDKNKIDYVEDEANIDSLIHSDEELTYNEDDLIKIDEDGIAWYRVR